MFGGLPEVIKQQVIYYLQHDNFRAAKEIYDTWHHDQSSNDQVDISNDSATSYQMNNQ